MIAPSAIFIVVLLKAIHKWMNTTAASHDMGRLKTLINEVQSGKIDIETYDKITNLTEVSQAMITRLRLLLEENPRQAIVEIMLDVIPELERKHSETKIISRLKRRFRNE